MSIRKVLVIKHGALGDFILATGPMRAIREHHKDAHITLLTTPPYKTLGEATGWFDDVWVDTRPSFWKIRENFRTIHRIRDAQFDRVYDLQTSSRSNFYFRALGRKKPQWNGIIEWCSHPHLNPERKHMHTIERQAEQLSIAGIETVPRPNVGFLKADISRFNLPERYALVVAGGSKHRPEKRWSMDGFQKLGNWLLEKEITPVFLGTKAEKWHVHDIVGKVKGAINLTDGTSFAEIAELARHAQLAVGNDTGPMHLIAAAKCPSFVLFSEASKPELCAPWGKHVTSIQEPDLSKLDVMDVRDVIEDTLDLDKPANQKTTNLK
ncbi:MAG: glycosyltransferase family 9 protein [Hyphomicrobiales bacterium]|nr:glycosyltransferase family 9 protein [Hyphomicrobiales bacterium]